MPSKSPVHVPMTTPVEGLIFSVAGFCAAGFRAGALACANASVEAAAAINTTTPAMAAIRVVTLIVCSTPKGRAHSEPSRPFRFTLQRFGSASPVTLVTPGILERSVRGRISPTAAIGGLLLLLTASVAGSAWYFWPLLHQ